MPGPHRRLQDTGKVRGFALAFGRRWRSRVACGQLRRRLLPGQHALAPLQRGRRMRNPADSPFGRFADARLGRAVALALAMLAALVHSATAQPTAVDLQLVLAVDASGSVNQQRFELQKQGYALAFANPKVLQAIRSGAKQAIAATMFQWTGPGMTAEVVGWMVVKDQASAKAFSAAIAAAPRQLFSGGTSVSGAIDYGVKLHAGSGFVSARR